MNKHIITLLLLFVGSNLIAKEFNLEALLKKKIPTITKITKLKAKDHFVQEYEIMLTQPLDHNNPSAGSFEQRVFLSHVDRKSPMLIVTEGYGARQRTYELSKILRSNQLTVEYRYYGKSAPMKMDWNYLKNDHAMDDLHKLRKLFGKIYKKKWVATGISKGGSTTLIYKSKYPKDVKVSVPYVAPLALAQEDKRCDEHILKTGSDACRKHLEDLQIAMLKNREAIIPMVDEWAAENKQQFTFMTTDKAFEYAVLEYTFSFWQWGHDCDKLPDPATSTPKELFENLNEIVGFSFYSDATCQYFLPSYYQFFKELGYYGFIKEPFKDLLVAVPNPTNLDFCPKGVDMSFTPYCQDVIDYLDVKGNNIIYIYGALDTWTACGYHPTKATNSLRMDKVDGSHTTRISTFDANDQQKIYDKLEKWLKMKVYPLPAKKS